MVIKFISILSLLCGLTSPTYDDGRLSRCEPYRERVVAWLEEAGVPRSYYFLMVAESGCRDNATSRMGAIGFWQLMPSTARRFGCLDAHDLRCATLASAGYLRSLSRRFDSEEGVVYGYNMGGTNYKRIGRATREARGLWATIRRLKRDYNRTAIRLAIRHIGNWLTGGTVRLSARM